jgi:hypothetical protein
VKEELKNDFVRPLLPFGLSCLLLIVLLCALSQATEAEPSVSSAAMERETNRLGSLDYQTGVSVCRQTWNLVPNPGFEQGGGTPDHWHEHGPCLFSYDDPGPNSGHSALILASSSRNTDCVLYTSIEEIPVEPGRFYDYSAMIRANLAQGDAYLRITFWSWQENDWNHEGFALTTRVTDTQWAWVQATGSVQAPADAEYARIYAVLPESSKGSVWFDDVFLGLSTSLGISKNDNPDPVEPGEMLTYTIVYSNTGREKATDLQIIETYTKYVDFEWAQPPPDKGNHTWEFPEILPGDSGTITVVVQVDDDADVPAIVNCVELYSDETVKLIYTCIATIVRGDGCAIVVYPPKAEKTVGPGGPANYYLTVYNVGSCDGRADLAATSSRGWGITIAPSTTYTLPKSDFQEVTVGLTVPLDARGGVSDVTSITATLVCGPPCDKTVTATAAVTTTIGVAPTAVEIGGPETGHVDTAYTFIATVSPPTATDPIYTWFPPPMAGQGSAIVTYTWSTTGTKTMTVTATNASGAAVGFHSISIGEYKVYLPLVLRNWPPIPDLYPIDNADIDGDYDVCWSAAAPPGYHYVLEESTNSACTGATPVYTGADIHHPITDKDVGWYYYHVKVCDSSRCFDPSNCVGVGAWWEQEDNEPRSDANGPLISSKDYHGYPDDVDDWFEIHLNTRGQVVVTLSNHTGTGGVQLVLYDKSGNLKCRDWTRPFDLKCTVPAGCYYIRIWTPLGHNTGTPYTLHATFP